MMDHGKEETLGCVLTVIKPNGQCQKRRYFQERLEDQS